MSHIKKRVKEILAAFIYFLYEKHILPCSVKVMTIDETLDELLHTEKSMVRFGDGEIVLIRGKGIALQQASPEISKGLSEILRYRYDDLIVGIPDIFVTLSDHCETNRRFWQDHLLFCRKIYEKYCDPNRVYGSSLVSRCYCFCKDKSRCDNWFAKIRKIWENKDVVIVEGTRTHNGVGNDLFDGTASIERIICPPKDAYGALPSIMEACLRYDRDRLFLLSVGIAAKFLALELFRQGYRVLDIGNLDLEYEWYVRKAADKIPLEKHDIVGEEANRAAGYHEYLEQVRVWL